MYLIQLPPDLMKALWELREVHQRGPIVRQVREAVERYVAALKREQAAQPEPLPFVQTEAGHLLETQYRHLIKALLKAEGIEPPATITIRLKGGGSGDEQSDQSPFTKGTGSSQKTGRGQRAPGRSLLQ